MAIASGRNRDIQNFFPSALFPGFVGEASPLQSQRKAPWDEVGYKHSFLGHNIQDDAEFKMSFHSLVD